MENEREKRVKERWGDAESTATLRDLSWTASAVVCRYLNRRVTGNPRGDWPTWLDHLVLRPRGVPLTCLVLGCGEGWLERALAPSPAILQIDAMDVSWPAIQRARKLATDQGVADKISYIVINLDRDPLPEAKYDVVIAHSVLHHVERLEYAYGQIEQALRPGGLFVINEYIGPNRLQYSDNQLERINAIMKRLPEHLRRSALSGEILTERIRPPLDVVVATDPSEAIRSEEVMTVARERFSILVQIDCGGTVLQPLLFELAPNFKDGDPEHDAILGLLSSYEETLIEAGSLPSDYVFALAKRRCDGELSFRLPDPPRPSFTEAPQSPWTLKSRLPETSGFSIVSEHLNRRITGKGDQDPIEWCLQRIRRDGIRPLSLCKALVLERSEFVATLATQFKKLDVWRDDGEKRSGYQLLFSACSLFAEDLQKETTAKMFSDRLEPGGHLIALASVRKPGEVPPARACALIQTVAAQLTARLAFPGLPSVPPTSTAARPIDINGIRAAMAQGFSTVEVRAVGWSVLQVLLPCLAPRLNEQREDDRTLLGLLCLLDESWVDDGLVPPDFVFVHGKK